MINLLPSDIKIQLHFSRRNTAIRHYMLIGLIVAASLALLLIGGVWYANRQINDLKADLASRQQTVDSYKTTQTNVQALESNLKIFSKLLDQKTYYSKLLADLANLMPAGAYINHLALTGDDSQPMAIALTVKSFNQAAQVRNALEASSRINSADIQTITKNSNSNSYAVVIVIGFEPGGSR